MPAANRKGTKNAAPARAPAPVPPQLKAAARRSRRRGRPANGFGSDDELEREARSDSEESNVSSDSDSETEPTPATHSKRPANGKGKQSTVIAATSNWSEMVTEEESGKVDIPVIDFADIGTHLASSTDATDRVSPSADPPSTSGASRRPGHTARQAYQQRLEDPSYIPRVGEFWGHDDRLMDKDLRSLSGWWRGKWRGGRGGMRGGFGAGWTRGRGGFTGRGGGLRFAPGHDQGPATAATATVASTSEPGPSAPETRSDPPPIERPWTHDAFEAMKEADTRRDTVRTQPTNRGRGAYLGPAARGRGAWFGRGGNHQSPLQHLNGSHSVTTQANGQSRPWYPKKPERSWTKHADGYLHKDPSMRAKGPDHGPAVRIKVPGSSTSTILRLTSQRSSSSVTSPSLRAVPDRPIVVKLPSTPVVRARLSPAFERENSTTVADLPIDVLSPKGSNNARINLQPSAVVESGIPSGSLVVPPKANSSSSVGPMPHEQDRPAMPDGEKAQWQSHPPPGDLKPQDSSTGPPLALDIAATQTGPPPMAYGSPYGYPMALPPGIALGENGMYYEVATGRMVYLAPPPMFTHSPPPPMAHPPHHGMMPRPGSVSFIPQAFHPMTSPDYQQPMGGSQRHTPDVPYGYPPSVMYDPTGNPIFALPRPARVEIRPPPTAAYHHHHHHHAQTSAQAQEDANLEQQRQQPSPPVSDRVRHQPSHHRTPSTLRDSVNAAPFQPGAANPTTPAVEEEDVPDGEPHSDGFIYSSPKPKHPLELGAQPSTDPARPPPDVVYSPPAQYQPLAIGGMTYYYPPPGPAYVWGVPPHMPPPPVPNANGEYEYQTYDPNAHPSAAPQYETYPAQPPMVYY